MAYIWARAIFGVHVKVSAEPRGDAKPHIIRADGEVLASFVGAKSFVREVAGGKLRSGRVEDV